MDVYPEEYITHEAPLLVVSGLGSPERHWTIPPYPLLENGPCVTSSLPSITAPIADHLIDYFNKNDAAGMWCGRPERGVKGTRPVFRIRTVGRAYRLPPRKANSPSPSSPTSPTDDSYPTRSLHSPISPLSPDSPLYPDGVFLHIWLRKHQSLLPAVFTAFHELYVETDDVNQQNLKDNEIIASINLQRKHFLSASSGSLTQVSSVGSDELRSSGHRTKFVAVIISGGSILSSPNIEDRLSFIRRNTNLTTNATFFFLPKNSSPVELEQFVSSLLATLYPGAIEYYREMTKHSRRKRNKGSIPTPTVPTARALSSQAWILRYEIKLGIFAEFRQEMDAAGKNYETAYEKLFTEVFESTSSWTERWSEARLLSDVLTLRMIRCNLWNANYVAAKQRWSYHMKRTRDILDRKGKGTETYGFAAWLSRWNKCLAELIQSGNLPVFTTEISGAVRPPLIGLDTIEHDSPAIYAEALAIKSTNRHLSNMEILHHAGFYYLAASEWIKTRKARVSKISRDDWSSSDLHDTYLCPQPQEEAKTDHAALEISLLLSARAEFELRKQRRMADSITYRLVQLKMPRASEIPDLWCEILKDLRKIAPGYRKEGWWEFLEDVLWRILECGKCEGDPIAIITAAFELMCTIVFKEKEGWIYDLGCCLNGLVLKDKPMAVVRAREVVSMLSVSYTFESSAVHVGQTVHSQLTLSSSAHPSSAPLVFSELEITYEGGLKTVIIKHDPLIVEGTCGAPIQLVDLKGRLQEDHSLIDSVAGSATTSSKTYLVTNADLSIYPGQTKVYELSSILREVGSAKIMQATFGILNERFGLDLIFMLGEDATPSLVHPLPTKKVLSTNGGNALWWISSEDGTPKKRPIRAAQPERLIILPRPPKIEVFPKGLEKGTFINEVVKVELEVMNGEDEDADVKLSVKLHGWADENPPEIGWVSNDGSKSMTTTSAYNLGILVANSKSTLWFSFVSSSIPIDCTMEIKVQYHLLSDPETPIEKTATVDMPITNPFHPTFDFSPRVHPEPWSDYFSLSDDLFNKVNTNNENTPHMNGITQRWCLTTTVLAVGEDTIIVEGWELPMHTVEGGADCSISAGEQKPMLLNPNQSINLPFILDIQKYTFEDRSPSTIDTSLSLHWRRTSESPLTTTTLPVPRLFIPLREPRVLASLPSNPSTIGVLPLSYTIENPTNYFLTFSVLMETNPDFAFSGPKQTNIQLLPMSKSTLKYRLYPYVRNAWIKPSLKVVDRYFNKALKCSPGSEGMGMDKMGLVVWVSGDFGNMVDKSL
ncbi:Gryzun, putative trafficking through golgi-domain-containing protein [Geopyxis carbonaria]|nr:Gryzun, putative trafficking through golgi-domain-containing protein [Geopyxis carbonaria]